MTGLHDTRREWGSDWLRLEVGVRAHREAFGLCCAALVDVGPPLSEEEPSPCAWSWPPAAAGRQTPPARRLPLKDRSLSGTRTTPRRSPGAKRPLRPGTRPTPASR